MFLTWPRLLLLAVCLGGILPLHTLAAEPAQRFAMAISGGASKGAYEAGLNWGILKILKGLEQRDLGVPGDLRTIEAASFSGASAGGINTLLSALQWCSRAEADGGLPDRINANIFRDIWLLPDVNRLLPPSADSAYYGSGDAMLSRHDLLQAAARLRAHWNSPAFRSGCRVPLGVTVTRVEPERLRIGGIDVQNQRFYIPFEARTQTDGTLKFFFDPADYPQLSDPAMILMPRSPSAPPLVVEDQRVEDAVLTSAAFPGGFGRMRLQYCRLMGGATGETDQAIAVSAGAEPVCPERYELAEAEFADGGLFDNLPIGLARILAERHRGAGENPLPVTYVYLDPNRLRYQPPKRRAATACSGPQPPEACELMEYSFFSEQSLLLGALGTARKYELYRELTSENWTLNLSELSYALADRLSEKRPAPNCASLLPYFDDDPGCAESLRRTGQLLDLAYDRLRLPVIEPFSVLRLRAAGVVSECRRPQEATAISVSAECDVDVQHLRRQLAAALVAVIKQAGLVGDKLDAQVRQSRLSMHNDRALRVSSRGAPITGTLLGDFGAFLDLKFREFDYYVGTYDAVVIASNSICSLLFSPSRQDSEYATCRDALITRAYAQLAIEDDPRGRYVFARLAQWEFASVGALRFAYQPLPPEDRDMRIIFDGLLEALQAGEDEQTARQDAFFTEDTFFRHLKAQGFTPTPAADGKPTLLAQIIEDPKNWPAELTRRATTRLVRLEQQAAEIYAAREPDPEQREQAHTVLMGSAAFVLQTTTYNYPDFTFAPSTAPDDWVWRYVIPYEIGWDIVRGDMTLTWQPTWSLSNRDRLGTRFGLGFAGGLFDSYPRSERENYVSLGLDYTRSTGSGVFSSWGATPTVYYAWEQPREADRGTFGGDLHLSLFKDRLRLGVGTRDFRRAGDEWFLTLGITDIPGLGYWLTR